MSALRLLLLGPPRLERDGVPLELGRRKAIALLAYLAVTGEIHSRETLATFFWPDYDDSRARANLRRVLAVLHQVLGEGWLATDWERLGLDWSAQSKVWLDVAQFRRRLAECQTHGHPAGEVCPACLTSLAEAVELYRADFMAGFTLPDSPDFDEWQSFQTESLRRELAGALERLARGHSAQGQFELAIPSARRWLVLDPLHEPAHRSLMELYAQIGQQAAAWRQYQECVRLLEEELGVPPQAETIALYERLRHGPERGRRLIAQRFTPTQEQKSTLMSIAKGEIFPSVPPSEVVAEALHSRSPASPPLPPFLSASPPPVTPAPFVARDRELTQLNDFLALTLAGQGRVAFVTGEAGTGKTALVEAFAQRAHQRQTDLIVASGSCHAYTGIGDPYLPFREVLGLLTGDVEAKWAAGAISREQAEQLWALMPHSAQALMKVGSDLIDIFIPGSALATRAATVAPSGTGWLAHLEERVARKKTGQDQADLKQSDLFEQYTQVLQTLAQQRPLLLTLDDLQWADSGSINLLFHLGRRLEGHRIFIVGTYRLAEVALGRPSSSSGNGDRHPLEPVVNEFQRHFGQIKVDLRQAEDQQFVEQLLDTEPNRLSPMFRAALYEHTRGQALFTLEMLRDMQERGDLVQDEMGRWVEGSSVNWQTLPARVEGVIGERLGRLPTGLQEILKSASVQGEDFIAEVVARVQGVDQKEVVRQLSSVLDKQHRLVRSQGSQRLDPGGQRLSHYRFRHILFQRYMYNSLDEVERAYLHESVGDMLETLYGDRSEEIAVQLAWHFQEAEVVEKAVACLLQAGNRAFRLSGTVEAMGHLSQALELLDTLPDTPQRSRLELDLQLALGSAASVNKGSAAPETEKAYARALELCRQMEETPQLFPVLWGLHGVYLFQADFQKTLEASKRCMRIAQRTQDPDLLLQAHHAMWGTLFFFGELSSALAHVEQGIALYDPERHHAHTFLYGGHDPGLCCRWLGASALCLLGYPDQALRRIQEALTMAQERPHHLNLAATIISASYLHQLRREGQIVQEWAEAAITISTEQEIPSTLAEGTLMRGWALAEQGQVEEGIVHMRQGIAGWQATGMGLRRPQHLGLLAEAYGKAGQLEEGFEVLDEALEAADKTGERLWEAELYRLKGELLLNASREGRNTKDELSPDEYFRQAIDIAHQQKAKWLELRATVSLGRLWHGQGKKAEARQMLAEIYGWFSEGFDTVDLQEAKAFLEELS